MERRKGKMNFRDVLELESRNVLETMQKCGQLLKHLPKGRMSVQTKNNRNYYRAFDSEGVGRAITKNAKLIEQLTSRHVAEAAMKNAAYNAKMLDEMIRNYRVYDPNEIVRMLSPAYQNISPESIEAMGFPYLLDVNDETSAPDLHPEHLTQTDTTGSKRRSKSELSIGAIYRELNLSPSYEDTIVLPDGFVFHPDFSLYCPLHRKKKFQEHVGNLTDPKVLSLTTYKFTELVTFGYYPFEDFIFTFEDADGNINLQEIKILIETFMT